jgi:uncharacterized protein (DUF362 family)/NAD-dependent dihydropyrimidine dehydrogenase PreA subunit
MKDVYIALCADYDSERVYSAMKTLLDENGLLDFVKPGMKIGIKANLVSFLKPEAAATTHPEVLRALSKILTELGALVIIGDSPGGLYTPGFVEKVYTHTGMKELEGNGVSLNRNFSQKSAIFPQGVVLKAFQYTAWLDECDAIINFCKLKSHGMMGMSAAAKNMFGVIPGTMKPEYHFRFKNPQDFARMIVDLNSYFKPVLSVCDAVVGMEGNGPTAGTPRKIGGILASASPHKMDLLCADLIGLDVKEIPTLMAAIEQGLAPHSAADLDVDGDPNALKIPDFKNIEVHNSLLFAGSGGVLGTVFSNIAQTALTSKPVLQKNECVGCAECYKICPAKAITMVDKKPEIDRKKCIKCFCCQEFCPKGALKVKRPIIAKILNK